MIELLNKNPNLLLIDPSDAGKTNVDTSNNFVIQSKYTHVKFYAEDALTMAVKRRQLEMIKLLLPYYDQLGDAGQAMKAKALAAWKTYKAQRNAVDEGEIVIPDDYMQDANELVNLFIEERFANGTGYNLKLMRKAAFDKIPDQNKNMPYLIEDENKQYFIWGKKENQWQLTKLDQDFKFPSYWSEKYNVDVYYNHEIYPTLRQGHEHALLSQETEEKLSLLFKKLIPEDAVKCDYLDPELLLLAAYRALDNALKSYRFAHRFGDQLRYARSDAFRTRVLGLIQSVLSPETAKVFCQDFTDYMNISRETKLLKINFSEQAKNLRLQFKNKMEEIAFYRSSQESRNGLGFDFSCPIYYKKSGDYLDRCNSSEEKRLFDKFYQTKNSGFRALVTNQPQHAPAPVRNQATRV